MFMIDWSQEDYRGLNFYDLFEPMYKIKYGKLFYVYLQSGESFEPLEAEFEDSFKTYFLIDEQEIQKKTTYYEERSTYQYRPRGIHEVVSSFPYPEVVDYEENEDGTIKLMVNTVWQIKVWIVHFRMSW